MPETTPDKKSLILCVHSHQPVGNFDSVFKEAFERSYKPFFEVAERYASLKFACHFSGSLIDWLETHEPDFLRLLSRMNDRSQLEFIGGGYYEPIYGLIPKNDLAGQIAMMSGKIKTLFGKSPEGVWLTERVWDPDLVGPLSAAGVKFTILDDFHFEKAGKKAPVTGYYRTKRGRQSIDLFASMKQLRYLMPFRKADETLEFIHSTPAKPEDVFVFADDSEKFGMWPGTYAWVYTQGWLDRFFTLLEKDESIRVMTFSEARREFSPKGTVRIPHASYEEMMEWSGGRFYNFFDKYSESRYMRDRMWSVSGQLKRTAFRNGSRPLAKKAKESLYKAQCNCPYWHGVFGGLYLHHLRSAIYENLIQAENSLRHGKNEKADIRPVVLGSGLRWQMRQAGISSFFNSHYGGAMEELDYLPKSVNLMCNLQRHKEPYHETVLKKKPASASAGEPLSIHEVLGAKEKDLDKHLHYDKYRKLSFLDHFFEAPVDRDTFAQCKYAESGDFADGIFSSKTLSGRDGRKLIFQRRGSVTLKEKRHPLLMKKTITPRGGDALEVTYQLTNKSRVPLRFTAGTEFNFSIGDEYAVKGVDQPGVKEWIFRDAWRGIAIRLVLSGEARLLAAPIETISESELGLERTYQQLGVLVQRPWELAPGETKEQGFTLSVSS